MNKKRVVATGMGVVCPIGLNVAEFWASLAAGKSGINRISSFDTANSPVKVAGEVRNFDPTQHMDLKTVQRTRRAIHFAIPATKEAVARANLDMTQEQPGQQAAANLWDGRGTSSRSRGPVRSNRWAWGQRQDYSNRALAPAVLATDHRASGGAARGADPAAPHAMS